MKKESEASGRKHRAADATKRLPRSTDSPKPGQDEGVLSEAELEKVSAGKDVKVSSSGSEWDQR